LDIANRAAFVNVLISVDASSLDGDIATPEKTSRKIARVTPPSSSLPVPGAGVDDVELERVLVAVDGACEVDTVDDIYDGVDDVDEGVDTAAGFVVVAVVVVVVVVDVLEDELEVAVVPVVVVVVVVVVVGVSVLTVVVVVASGVDEEEEAYVELEAEDVLRVAVDPNEDDDVGVVDFL